MRLVLAEHSGFCFGVQKAIEKAIEEMEKSKELKANIFALGPLIHNKQVVDDLQSRGLVISETIDEIENGSVIIRSHGVPKQIYKDIKKKSLHLVDTTCPFVKRIQKIVDQYHKNNYNIVIIGSALHPEVVGINGWCDHEGYVIQSLDEIEKIATDKPLCVVSQTTMPIPLFEKIVSALKKRHENMKVFNTICLATQDRQDAALELSQQVDAMIVIGGRHSSNTQKLVELCKRILPEDTYAIEQSSDLNQYNLSKHSLIGVTAGASTPNYIIQEVMQKIEHTYRKTTQIAIDGPAGAGKSTIAKKLAKDLNFLYIDTGAMYRAITYKLLINHIEVTAHKELVELLTSTNIRFEKGDILLDNEVVTHKIRSPEVTNNVSKVSAIKDVRMTLLDIQQEIASNNDIVMDGRDIGTRVLPTADLKIFLTASVEERAHRRYQELKEDPSFNLTLEDIKKSIEHRDYEDENRELDPLTPAKDAIFIDTTEMSINEVVEKIKENL
ncbi:4-hydroxy-3-methylbut-2-enyl diphosphate reductase [Tindallia californiensis]|uniref:Multifunctional fusion protein n=1 Tax=Tindallia californiensis TaxID=159292 RepID=A0A1H3NLX0_9FIRM|nr:4-hydroxy-3-methylbut-2-enyl diphosphate reductase [Tindallia californiensis]SDY89916.1 cytidylate kinase/(E)-4-hydroxy-3-methyl-but-2-enyl pyrophosphate reductase (IPP and DMAPP forming),TIGR00216 [Tindallia californiensis]